MDFDDIILSHPHDYFRIKQLTVLPGTCFVIMPFASEFRIVYDTIQGALRGLMVCDRADEPIVGKPILERILHGIGSAELIIADLTGRNPNVFYELGLAHTRTKNILLLTQNVEDVPFDLRSLFCHVYSPHSKESLKKLAKTIRLAAADVRARSLPRMLEGVTARTKKLVDYMLQQLDSPKGVRGLMIRIQASVSSLGNIGNLDSDYPEKEEYLKYLEKERELLIRLVEEGASLQAIISPHIIAAGTNEPIQERKIRLERIIAFLKEREDCMTRCRFAISPTGGPNLWFFSDEILFEGLKTEVERGFGWTMVYTDSSYINVRTRIFDRLFESAQIYTIQRYGEGLERKTDQADLKQAVITALELAKNH